MARFDLTKEDGVLAYLVDRFPDYAGFKAIKIAGGNTNFTFRIYLKNEIIREGISYTTIFLKHATDYSASNASFPLPKERQMYEVAGLRYTNKLFDAHSLVKSARLFEYDADACAILMSDAGEGSKTLKELLINNRFKVDTAAQLGRGLGEFLAKLHEHGRTAPEREEFAKHHWAKTITAWYYHDRLIDCLKSTTMDPPIILLDDQLAEIKQNTSKMSELIKTSEETLIMGDFWSGNVIIQMDESEDGAQTLRNVLVVDWEIAKLGTPGNDIGQFAAEVTLPYTFYPDCSKAAEALMSEFCDEYRAGSINFDERLVDVASKQLGSHLTVLTPEIKPWNENRVVVRGVVEDGMDYLTGKKVPKLLFKT